MKSFGDMLLCLFQDVGDVRAPAVVFERAKRGIHNGDGKISVVRAELTGLSGSTTLRKHFELLAKHVTFGNFQFFALRVAVLASLNIQRGSLVELIGRVPGLEVDFVVQQTFRSKHANGEDTGRGPARADVPYFGIGKFQKGHGLIVHFGAHGRKFRGHGTSFDDFATEIMQHVELMNGEIVEASSMASKLSPVGAEVDDQSMTLR